MELKDLDQKLTAVLGFGREGQAVTEYLLKHGITPVLFDQRPWEQWAPEEQEKIKALNLNFIFGPDCLKELTGFHAAFRSPGLWRLHPDLLAAEHKGLKITSQTKWFFDHCPGKIVGVTGTKGKGTTSTLIYEMLKLNGQWSNVKGQMFLTGNIGKIQPFEFLDDMTERDIVVFELSSFQLQDLHKSPHIAVCLMVTQEHLDQHRHIREYHAAKSSLTVYQKREDVSIYNIDYPATRLIGEMGQAHKKLSVSTHEQLREGCFIEQDQMVAVGIFPRIFSFPCNELKLKGRHNLENVCAAVAAAGALDIEPEAVADVLKSFAGLEHRLEPVGAHEGVAYYNDSFSTVPETAIAAIKAFTEPEIIILGGSTKHSDFTELGQVIRSAHNIKAVILIGQEAERIREVLGQGRGFNGQVLTGAASMEEILGQARSVATAGDVVLLSPACASFGMFKNYKDRGERFKELVKNLSRS